MELIFNHDYKPIKTYIFLEICSDDKISKSYKSVQEIEMISHRFESINLNINTNRVASEILFSQNTELYCIQIYISTWCFCIAV